MGAGIKVGVMLARRFVVAGIAVLVTLASHNLAAETSGNKSKVSAYGARAHASSVEGVRTCSLVKQKNRGAESALVSRMDGVLAKVTELSEGYFVDQAVTEQRGYEDRLKRFLEAPDLLHQRCWFDDQLSCTLFGSSLQDLRISLSKVIESDLNERSSWSALAKKQSSLVVAMRRLENDLIDRCRKLPWNLG